MPRRSRKKSAIVAVSLTPLIDVVFILLVFFMLASNFNQWNTIELTASAADGLPSSMEGAFLVGVGSGDLRLAGEPVSLDELTKRVSERLKVDAGQAVVVQPDRFTALQRTVDILDALYSAGAVNVTLDKG